MIKPDLNKAKEAMNRVADAVASGEPVMRELPDIYRIRDICGGCDKNYRGQCSECTCFIKLKSMLKTEQCPLGKWK